MSHQRVSGFPEKGADLWGGPGNFGEVRELPGKSGKLPWNLWIAAIAFKIHSEKSSGEVAGELPGKSGEILGSPGTFQKLGGAWLPPSDTPK